MHLTEKLRVLLEPAIAQLTKDAAEFTGMIRPTSDPKHGDYQCNAAMPLAKRINGENPRSIAEKIVNAASLDSICDSPSIAGPGFINLRLRDDWIAKKIMEMLVDPRCGVSQMNQPKRVLVDFSSPNVAKPMHVGHIRSTVIGDCLSRTLRFLGHEVITDNHLGDWGTQFGIIIYGYKHFGDPEKVKRRPVAELADLYRLVNQISSYQKAKSELATIGDLIAVREREADTARQQLQQADGEPAKTQKKRRKSVDAAERQVQSARQRKMALQDQITEFESRPELVEADQAHPNIADRCLRETAKLHEGDAENLNLWKQFLPHCRDEIDRVYERLNVTFDHTLGESFYHDGLAGVVKHLIDEGLASESEGAICVFLDGFDAPMIVRKKDGAFLYATTDLATLKYRLEEFSPDEILYVVDTRQSEHFDKLFVVADLIGMEAVKLVHVNFGTVLGEDGRPMKTRSGTLIGLESLLDDAVARAADVVCDPERLSKMDPPMTPEEQREVAETVGIGAIKFADLSHHRTSDYRFNLDKMVALEGNTATYVQYSYARTQSILRKWGKDEGEAVRAAEETGISLDHPNERTLALRLLRLEEALAAVRTDYAPNHLTDYLFETSRAYATFNEQCPVLKAETETSQATRLALVVVTGRVLELGLSLLGIPVVPRM